ncbi:MAG: hypothetical protein ACJ75H_10910 [Thermoanaerobaculia bacterium]
MQERYIVWQECGNGRAVQTPVPVLLGTYPEVSILRTHGSDQAVVLMDTATEKRIRDENPGLSVELDVRHRMV